MASAQTVALDNALRSYGEHIILRKAATGVDVTVRGVARAFRPEELVGGVSQNDLLVIISPTQIRQSGWPGTLAIPDAPFNVKPWMPAPNDKVILQGRMHNIMFVKPFVVNDEIVRIELTIKG